MSSPSVPSTNGSTYAFTSTSTADAPKPFDASALSDVILRSSDSVDFFTLQSLLRIVSPVFYDMFSFVADATDEHSKDGLPVVAVSEDSETLLCLLSLIYPHPELRMVHASPFVKTSRAARKYAMDVIESKLRAALKHVESPHEPDTDVASHFLRFAIATQFGWRAEATRAALHTLSTPLCELPYNDELRNISGADFFDYLDLKYSEESKILLPVEQCSSTAAATDLDTDAETEKPFIDAEKPFDSSGKADMILRSTDRIDFYVLRGLIGFVTPIFDSVSSTSQKNGLPVLDIEEDSATLRHLLSLIHPCVESQIDDIDTFMRVARAAQRHGMSIVGEMLRQKLDVSRHIEDDPVRTLWVAIAFGWGQVAKKAAMHALALPAVIVLDKELWLVTSADVYWFYKYRLACGDAACQAVLQDELFASPMTRWDNKAVQRIIERLKSCPRGTSIIKACKSDIRATSQQFLFELMKKRDKFVAAVEDAISKVCTFLACRTVAELIFLALRFPSVLIAAWRNLDSGRDGYRCPSRFCMDRTL